MLTITERNLGGLHIFPLEKSQKVNPENLLRVMDLYSGIKVTKERLLYRLELILQV
jgi:hypothetical protein